MQAHICPACQRPIVWAVHERTHNRAPFDPGLDPDGNVEIALAKPAGFDGPLYTYRVVPKAEREAEPRGRHLSHFVTCTDPDRFRRSIRRG